MQSDKAALEIKSSLASVPYVGFDCAWVKDNPVALLQMAIVQEDRTKCFLFRLSKFDIMESQELINLLRNSDHVNLGVGIMGDIKRLEKDYSIGLQKSKNLDLRYLARDTKIQPGGLASLVRQVLNRKLDKDWRIQVRAVKNMTTSPEILMVELSTILLKDFKLGS